jgi:hypothetical protein
MSATEKEKSKQCVHIKLDKTVYNDLRVILFQKDMYLSELLDEFITRVVSGDMYATSVVDALQQKKINAKIAKKKKKAKNKDRIHKEFVINENNTDMLYKLIEAGSQKAQK